MLEMPIFLFYLIKDLFFSLYHLYINKNEPPLQSPPPCLLLSNLWVSQLNPLSASCDQRAPVSWLGFVSHDLRHGPNRQVATGPLAPEHAALSSSYSSSSSSSNLNTQSAAAHLTFPTNQQSACFTFPKVYTAKQQQQLKQEKSAAATFTAASLPPLRHF